MQNAPAYFPVIQIMGYNSVPFHMEAHCLCRITIMLDVKMQYKKRGCPMLSYFLDALFIHSFQIVGAADRGVKPSKHAVWS